MIYSSPSRRLAAYLLDCLFLFAFFLLVSLTAIAGSYFFALIAVSMWGLWWFGSLFTSLWLYFAILESSSLQATFGKRILGLVVMRETGERISFLRASARHFCKFFSRLFFFIGFAMMFWTKKNQALHDKITKVVVVHRSAAAETVTL